MALKDKILSETMKLSQNPAVAKLLADERFMRLVVLAMSMPGRVSTFTTEQKEKFAKEMGLATSDEVRDLKRQLAALEDVVRRVERKL
ncbi:MAG: hypothetical protein IPM79_17725 [Polyangiaceae bacterium]|jgi:hypothetical protein|nr:hypothetical protein [Polyangiaceae bacterium]MBK8939408.1 hypothetical protein [Polyangiaceae bacterium]